MLVRDNAQHMTHSYPVESSLPIHYTSKTINEIKNNKLTNKYYPKKKKKKKKKTWAFKGLPALQSIQI
jgi:hypothetical protein